jgi:hypothetical protein
MPSTPTTTPNRKNAPAHTSTIGASAIAGPKKKCTCHVVLVVQGESKQVSKKWLLSVSTAAAIGIVSTTIPSECKPF